MLGTGSQSSVGSGPKLVFICIYDCDIYLFIYLWLLYEIQLKVVRRRRREFVIRLESRAQEVLFTNLK